MKKAYTLFIISIFFMCCASIPEGKPTRQHKPLLTKNLKTVRLGGQCFFGYHNIIGNKKIGWPIRKTADTRTWKLKNNGLLCEETWGQDKKNCKWVLKNFQCTKQ